MLLWFGHVCAGKRMLSEHERYYGLGMDALVTVCSRNTYALGRGTLLLFGLVTVRSRNTNVLWFGHGCIGHGMFSKHQRY